MLQKQPKNHVVANTQNRTMDYFLHWIRISGGNNFIARQLVFLSLPWGFASGRLIFLLPIGADPFRFCAPSMLLVSFF